MSDTQVTQIAENSTVQTVIDGLDLMQVLIVGASLFVGAGVVFALVDRRASRFNAIWAVRVALVVLSFLSLVAVQLRNPLIFSIEGYGGRLFTVSVGVRETLCRVHGLAVLGLFHPLLVLMTFRIYWAQANAKRLLHPALERLRAQDARLATHALLPFMRNLFGSELWAVLRWCLPLAAINFVPQLFVYVQNSFRVVSTDDFPKAWVTATHEDPNICNIPLLPTAVAFLLYLPLCVWQVYVWKGMRASLLNHSARRRIKKLLRVHTTFNIIGLVALMPVSGSTESEAQFLYMAHFLCVLASVLTVVWVLVITPLRSLWYIPTRRAAVPLLPPSHPVSASTGSQRQRGDPRHSRNSGGLIQTSQRGGTEDDEEELQEVQPLTNQ